MPNRENRTALVLSGGGARAAYEVGVLRAIAEQNTSAGDHAPFSVYCGSSAGALNATALALSAEDFGGAVRRLTSFWRGLHARDVYRPVRRWLPVIARPLPRDSAALFDHAPLADRLEQEFDFTRLGHGIAGHVLRALCITCLGYPSGQSVSFFQGRADLEPWHHRSRAGAHVALGTRHVLASMATPFLFPAVKLNREYFGGGAARASSPLSPAVRLGADRIVVIGSGENAAGEQPRSAEIAYPNSGDLLGRMLSDANGLATDIERMAQVNRLLDSVPLPTRAQLPWRPIDLLVIEPSRSLEALAVGAVAELPGPVRSSLSRLADRDAGGQLLASHLVFEPGYLEKLIELGYKDTLARSGKISQFLSPKID